jgi:ABC-type transport system substrate-binding protein
MGAELELKQLIKTRWEKRARAYDLSPGHGIHSTAEKRYWLRLLKAALPGMGLNIRDLGTGPFKLAEYKKDQQAVLVRNENYWGKKPKIQKLFWKYTPDPYAQLLALKAGELDIVGEPEHHSSIPLKNGILDKDGKEFEMELIVPTGEANADMISLVVQSQLSQVGVRMKISTLSNTSNKKSTRGI